MTEREHYEDWAAELWPDDDDHFPLPARQVLRGTPPPPPHVERSRVLLRLVTVALVAVAAGTCSAVAVKDLSSGSAASLAAGQPNASRATPAPGGGELPQEISGTMSVGGKVTAISPRSITITAGPQSVTARVTGSTRFSGEVKGIGGVHVGDLVFAQITDDNGVNSLVTLQDPYSVP
jgi:hypothetical protein